MMHDTPSHSTDELQDVQPSKSSVATPAVILAGSMPGSDHHSVDRINDELKPPNSSVPLQRSVYIVFLVLLYAAAALYAWVIICILTHRPIDGKAYGGDIWQHALPRGDHTVTEYLALLFAKGERYLRAARIVQSLVSVLTIPLTSAVCSQAAVVYIQRKRGNNVPTLRQSMALADKGWTDIALLRKLFFGGWSQHKSSLLLFAIVLHLLGAAISPVQQLFLSYKTIKRADSMPNSFPALTQFTENFSASTEYPGDDGRATVKLRSALESASTTMVEPRLWSSGNSTVNGIQNTGFSQNTLANLSTIPDPFWAELPFATNTGLLRQLAPRLNSTAKWENNWAGILPADCHPSSDALYFHYEYTDVFQYDVEICMPGNVTKTPWKNQNSRQDITEELYFKMNFSGNYWSNNIDLDALHDRGARPGLFSSKLTLHSTSGLFELPNYMNGQVPGPLLEGDPLAKNYVYARSFDNDTAWNTLNATNTANNKIKGPLQRITLALFGEGSFVDVNHTALAAYANSDVEYFGCIGIYPFMSLLNWPTIAGRVALRLNYCMSPIGRFDKIVKMHSLVATYFWIFSGDSEGPGPELLEGAFSAAAFLANDVFMVDNQVKTLFLRYAMGTDIQIPQISPAGIILTSLLLAFYLLCLVALAFYSACIPRWTGTLDSFAMMRIGASISDKIPLLATSHVERIKTLDETPGWIGNKSEGEVGELCLGGERPLKQTKCYIGYDTDHMAKSTAKRKSPRVFRREGYSLTSGRVPLE